MGRPGQALARSSPASSLFLLLAFAGIPLTVRLHREVRGVRGRGRARRRARLVVVGVLASAIAVFFYVRVIVLMYFSEPVGDATGVVAPSAR